MAKKIPKILKVLNERSTSAPGEVSLGDRIAGIRTAIWNCFGQVVGFVIACFLFVMEATQDPNVADGLANILKGMATTGGMLAIAASVMALFISYRAEVARKKLNDNRGVSKDQGSEESVDAAVSEPPLSSENKD